MYNYYNAVGPVAIVIFYNRGVYHSFVTHSILVLSHISLFVILKIYKRRVK